MNKSDRTPPLSPLRYTIIAVVGLVLSIGFTWFYVYQVPRLVENGVENRIFYLLLIPWALSAAVFLFGTMRSYARITYKALNNFVELGGPVALFVLVLLGGFRLVPTEPATFDLTVRPHSSDSRDPLITSGNITIDLDNDRRTRSIDSQGEADFKGIPFKFRGRTINILPQVEGFDKKIQQARLIGSVLDLSLARAAPSVIFLTGSIVPPPDNGQQIHILVDGQSGEVSPDEFGRFGLNVNGKLGDRIRLKIFFNRRMVYDDFQVLPGPVIVKLHSQR
jgi:hypothetical protein